MDNNNTPSPVDPQVTAVSEPQNTQTQENIPNRGTGLVGLLNSIPVKLAALLKKKDAVNKTNQTQATIPAQPGIHAPHIQVPPSVTKNYKKILLYGGGGLIILILIVTGILYLVRPKPPVLVATPTPAPVEPIATPIPTKYASDSAILQIEENLKILEQNISNTDLNEDNIKPRSLDFNVSFR